MLRTWKLVRAATGQPKAQGDIVDGPDGPEVSVVHGLSEHSVPGRCVAQFQRLVGEERTVGQCALQRYDVEAFEEEDEADEADDGVGDFAGDHDGDTDLCSVVYDLELSDSAVRGADGDVV